MALRFPRLVALGLAVLMTLPASAALVSGSFRGIAVDSRTDGMSPNPGNFDGQLVTGRFRLDTARILPPDPDMEDTPTFAWRWVEQGAFELVFHAAGQTAQFGIGEDVSNALFFEHGSGSQTVQFAANYTDFYHFASLVLAGPLFDGIDPATLRPGPVALEDSFAYFFDSRSFGASVQLTEVAFDGYAVPEPGGALLWLTALAGVGLWRARAAKA